MEEGKGKLKSRTFWLAMIWTFFVPIGMVVSVLMSRYEADPSFMGGLITQSGIIVAVYIGGNKARDTARGKKNIPGASNGQ